MALPRARLIRFAGLMGWLALVPSAASSAPVPKAGTTPFVKWVVRADPATNEMHDPAVIQNMVVVGTDRGDLCAYRVEDGTPLWKHRHGKRIFHRPCGDGKRIYFTSDYGLTAVASGTGERVWDYAIDHGGGPVLVLPKLGVVFVGGCDGKLSALDAKTGQLLRQHDFVTDAPPDPPGFDGARARTGKSLARPTALSTDGETLFLCVFDQSRVIAVGATTGKRLWSFQARGWIFGEAVATATRVFVGSQDQHLYCLDKSTGKPAWKFRTKSRVESGAAVDEAFVYFGSCDGGLYCVNQSDGKQRWRFDADPLPGGRKSAIYSVPLLRQGKLHFAAGEGQVYAVAAASGALAWKLRPVKDSELFCSPAAHGTHYFLVSRPKWAGQGKRTGESALVAIGLK